MKNAVVVTGVSTGIGLATARVLVDAGFYVFGSVRRQEDAERLSSLLGENVAPLLMDVTSEAAVRAGASVVARYLDGATMTGLVNNAGIAVSGPLLYLPLDQLRHQLEVNLVASLLVTQVYAPLLGTDLARRGVPGRIINMSSVAGKIGGPFLGPYAASKHALEGLSETLRRELMLYGIDVIIVAPGQVATPIWDKAAIEDYDIYKDTAYAGILDRFSKHFVSEGRKGLPAEAVAKVVLDALTAKHPKVRYAPVPQRLKNWTIPTLLPKRVLDRVIRKRLCMNDLHAVPRNSPQQQPR